MWDAASELIQGHLWNPGPVCQVHQCVALILDKPVSWSWKKTCVRILAAAWSQTESLSCLVVTQLEMAQADGDKYGANEWGRAGFSNEAEKLRFEKMMVCLHSSVCCSALTA